MSESDIKKGLAGVVVDTTAFAPTTPVMERDRPVVLHAPSHAALKGTHRAAAILTELDEAGVVEFRHLEHVPPQDMPAALADAESHSARQQILQRPEVVRDAQALVLATEALRIFRLLEAANAALHANDDEREARRRDRLVEQAETEGKEQRELATELLGHLRRELNLAATLSASKRTLSFRERAASRANAASSAHLAAIVNDLGRRLGLASVEPFIAPNRTAVDGAVPDAVLHGLPWVTGTPGERLIGFAEMNEASGLTIADLGRRRWVAVTDRSTYVMSPKTFESSAEIEHTIDNGDIRFVRVKKDDGRAPALTIVTTEDDLHLEFGSWARDGEAREAAESFAELLASLMRLPVEEVPVVEVPELDERPGAPRIER